MRSEVTASNATGSASAESAPSGVVKAVGGVGCSGSCVFVSQGGGGVEDGAACSSAHSLSWLRSHWGAGAGYVHKGVTVALCGTITEQVKVEGSGTSGEPVTILFEPNARIAPEVCPEQGCINLGGNSYVTIDGGTNGAIENTANGYKLAHEVSATRGIFQGNCSAGNSHVTIENLKIANMFIVRTHEAEAGKGSLAMGIWVCNISYLTIADNEIYNARHAANVEYVAGTEHINVEYNNFFDEDEPLALVAHGSSTSPAGPFVIAHNKLHEMAVWDSPGEADTFHHEDIFCYAENNEYAPSEFKGGLFIYDNWLYGQFTQNKVVSNMTAGMSLGAGSRRCGTKTAKIWIFNNLLTPEGGSAVTGDGLIAVDQGATHVFNNTIHGISYSETDTGTGAKHSTCIGSKNSGGAQSLKLELLANNLTYECWNPLGLTEGNYEGSGFKHNLWAGNESQVILVESPEHTFRLSSFPSWTSFSGEAGGKVSTAPKIKANGEPEAGSPALAAGENLTSTCEAMSTVPEAKQACKENILGEARPTSGPWNIGAY